MDKLHIVIKNKTRSWQWLRSLTLIVQFRLEESRGNHYTIQVWPKSMPYDYIVEVTNRLKGFRSDTQGAWRTMERWFVALYQRQWSRPAPRKENAKRQNGCLRRPWKYLGKEEKLKVKEKRKDTHLNVEFQRIARRYKKAFLSNQYKEIKENNRMEILEISSRKLGISREHFMQKWTQ